MSEGPKQVRCLAPWSVAMDSADSVPAFHAQFHDVARLLDERPSPHPLAPETSVRDALRIMLEHRCAHAPVRDAQGERGVFSLWGVATHLAAFPGKNLESLPVAELVTTLPEVAPDKSVLEAAKMLTTHDALAVRDGARIDIVTGQDVACYFRRQARPFLVVQEIELALRSLIDARFPGGELETAIEATLAGKYCDRRLPPSSEWLDFEDYRTLIFAKAHASRFADFLGDEPKLAARRLEQVRELRNRALHFRDDLTEADFQILRHQRDWLCRRLREMHVPVPTLGELDEEG